MYALYFLIPAAFFGMAIFILDFFAFNFYKSKAKTLPKDEKTYKYLLNKEGLYGLINLLSMVAMMALIITGLYFYKPKGNNYYGYGIALILSIIAAGIMILSLHSKRTEFLESIKGEMPYGDRRGEAFTMFISGMCFCLGNSIGLFITFIFDMIIG